MMKGVQTICGEKQNTRQKCKTQDKNEDRTDYHDPVWESHECHTNVKEILIVSSGIL